MNKILVTGGTGFVGRWMSVTQPHPNSVNYLNRREYDEGHWHHARWDYIVHLAPISPLEVINYCLYKDCRLLFASSGAVYERQTEYAKNKRKWEQECVNSHLNYVIARLFTFYGDGLDDDKAISRFSKAAALGKPIEIWGDGNTVRSYMSGEEMGKWMWAILFHGVKHEAYDVGSDAPITMFQLAQMVNESFGNKSEIVLENRPDDCPYYMPRNTEKTRRLLRELQMQSSSG